MEPSILPLLRTVIENTDSRASRHRFGFEADSYYIRQDQGSLLSTVGDEDMFIIYAPGKIILRLRENLWSVHITKHSWDYVVKGDYEAFEEFMVIQRLKGNILD